MKVGDLTMAWKQLRAILLLPGIVTVVIPATVLYFTAIGRPAATGVVMMPLAAPIQAEQPPTFRADHPFLFLIRENQTGSILFLGRVANPKE
jgi:hypothetical protein